MIRHEQLTVTAAGSAGSATGSATTGKPLAGKLLAVHLDYSASMAATSDVTLTCTIQGKALTLLTVSDNATDGWYFPRTQADSDAGAGLTFDGTRVVPVAFPLAGYVSAAVAQANANDAAVVTLVYED